MSFNLKPFLLEHVRLDCDSMESLLENLKQSIALGQTSFEGQIGQQLEKLNEADRAALLDDYADEAFGVFERFPNLMWRSMAFSLYSYFEMTMSDLCRHIREDGKNSERKVKVSEQCDLPGEKCLLEFGIKLPRDSKQWNRLPFYKALRNRIAHHGASVDNGAESAVVRTGAENMSDITISGTNSVIVGPSFCFQFMRDIQDVLTATIDAIPDEFLDA